MSHTIQLDYKDGEPAWRLRIVQPERFREVDYSVRVRLFALPKGALFAVLLKFYDVPDQPYFVHRVMDLTDPQVVRHVRACSDVGRMTIQFEPMGEQPGFERVIDLQRGEWGGCLRKGEAHIEAVQADGEAALEDFLTAFRPVSEELGVEAGWDEVDRRYPPDSA